MKELRIIELENRVEIWENNKLIAFGKKSGEMMDFVIFDGSRVTPEEKDWFIKKVVAEWVERKEYEWKDLSHNKEYLELLLIDYKKKLEG